MRATFLPGAAASSPTRRKQVKAASDFELITWLVIKQIRRRQHSERLYSYEHALKMSSSHGYRRPAH